MKSSLDKRMLAPWIVAMVAALAMASSLFLPYATAKGDMREMSQVAGELINGNLTNPSMFEFSRIYMDQIGESISAIQTYVTIGLTIAIVVSGLLTLLFAALKKPIAVIVFDALAFLAFLAQNFDFSDRGVVPSDNYNWGAGYYVLFAAAILTLAAAIWMFVVKWQSTKRMSYQVA